MAVLKHVVGVSINRRFRSVLHHILAGLSTRRFLAVMLLVPLALSACDGAAEREAAYFERGKALFKEGNLVKARIEFKNARQINPLNVEALYYLGLIAEKEKDFKGAFGAFQKVVEQEPQHLEGNIRYGRYLLLGGRLGEAEARAETVIKLNPKNAEGYALRGAVYLQQGKVPEARVEAETARKADPSSVTALTLMVGVLRKEGKNAEAVSEIRKGLSQDPKNISLWRVLVELHRLQGDIRRARAAYEEIIKLEPEVHQHRVDLARMLLGADQRVEAEKVLREGIAAFPNQVAPKEIYIEFLTSRSPLEVAESEIRKFIAGDPESNAFRFSLARLYMKHGKFQEAESVLREIEGGKSQPDVIKAKTTLARLRLRAGDIAGARKLVKSVLDLDPANGDALTTRARLLLRDRKDDEAITTLRTVLRDNPNSAEAHRLLGDAHLRARDLDLAADSFRKALSVTPGDEATRLQLIRIYTRQRNYDEALDLLEQSIVRSPKSLPLQARKVELLIAKRNVSRALATAKAMQARSAENESPLAQYALGRAFQAAGRHKEAIQAFERVLGVRPESTGALRGLVGSKLALKETKETISYLESMREDAPDNVFAVNLLGELYAAGKEYDNAEKAFVQATELKRDWRTPYVNLGKIMVAQGKPDRAVAYIKQGLVHLPKDASLLFSLGTVHHSMGNFDAALKAYDAVLVSNPDNSMAANNVAAIIADHKFKDAKSLERALQLAQARRDSKNPYFLDTLGWLYYRKGDYNLAVLYLKQAVEALPKHPYMNYHLAMAYYDSGNRDAARTHLEKAIADGASYPELEKARSLLKSMM